MKLRKVIVNNFRSLKTIEIPIEDNTILIGENNSGKTALLEAIQIALPWNKTRRNYPFTEYDYHMDKNTDTPETCDEISIELWFHEDKPEEWPEELLADLDPIIQTDPILDLNYIILRLTSNYIEGEENSNWEFLNLNRDPFITKSSNLNKFLSYIRLFYLSSLRDSKTEFSPNSKFWGKILNNIKISEDDKEALIEDLLRLNETLLNGDPRLEQLVEKLDKSKDIMDYGSGQRTSIRALPLKPWDLMSKSEVVIQPRGNEIHFPLELHGQGIQSLSVLFLFQAYIEIFLKPTFEPETEAILALEEPEAHLHPQATRSLAQNLLDLESQTIISTHSPFFIQEIPFKNIRMFRKKESKSKILYIKRFFVANIPKIKKIENFCRYYTHYEYDEDKEQLILRDQMDKDEFSKLLKMYSSNIDACGQISKMKKESSLFISDMDLAKLDIFAKRIRGEILFARGWFLCEGQSDYLIIKFFAELIEKSLDHRGITLIDFQNNGSVTSFIKLAENFEIPWIMICDGDDAGDDYKEKASKIVSSSVITDSVYQLPVGNDLEKYLMNNGFLDYYIKIIKENDKTMKTSDGDPGFEDEIYSILQKNKIEYALALVEMLRESDVDASVVPEFFSDKIEKAIHRT